MLLLTEVGEVVYLWFSHVWSSLPSWQGKPVMGGQRATRSIWAAFCRIFQVPPNNEPHPAVRGVRRIGRQSPRGQNKVVAFLESKPAFRLLYSNTLDLRDQHFCYPPARHNPTIINCTVKCQNYDSSPLHPLLT